MSETVYRKCIEDMFDYEFTPDDELSAENLFYILKATGAGKDQRTEDALDLAYKVGMLYGVDMERRRAKLK